VDSTAATTTVNITAVDDAPVVTAGATVSFTEQGSPVVLDSGLTLTDVDNLDMAGATVSIGGFRTGDMLTFVNQNGISGSFNTSTGVLTLSGIDSVANYQAALRSITFSSTSDNPTNSGANASRTISWTANDGTSQGSPASTLTTILPAPLPPGDSGPVVGPPPVTPPSDLPPPSQSQSPLPPISPFTFFNFSLPSFLNNSTVPFFTFTLPGGMPDFFEFAGFQFQIGPYGTLSMWLGAAATPGERDIDFSTALLDGGGLPSWPSFDWKTSGFNPPADAKGVDDIAPTSHDAQGHQATKVDFTVGQDQAAPDKATEASETTRAPEATVAVTERDPGAAGRSPLRLVVDSDRLGEAGPMAAAIAVGGADGPAAPAGKLGFSAQLRAAGRQGLLNDRQALLNSLHNGFGG